MPWEERTSGEEGREGQEEGWGVWVSSLWKNKAGENKAEKNHAYQWLLAAGRPKPSISQAALDCQSWPNLKRVSP